MRFLCTRQFLLITWANTSHVDRLNVNGTEKSASSWGSHKAVVCMGGPLGGCAEGGGKNACKKSWNLYQLIP